MNKNYTSWKEYVKKHIDKECNFANNASANCSRKFLLGVHL